MADEKKALVVGASRGLGHGLSLEFLRRGWAVTATVRSATGGTGFEDYHEQVTMESLDINNMDLVEAFVARLRGEVYDVVFLNAGILGPPDKTADNVASTDIAHLMMTNAVAPVRLGALLLPMVRQGTGILAFMSSVLGSVARASAHSTLYGASKAALNSLTGSLYARKKDEFEFTMLSIHPGWVRTDMGGEDAPLDVETSVRGIADVLEAQAGAGGWHFLDYKGETIPW